MGEVVLQAHWEEGKATVVRADRDVLITHQLLCEILAHPVSARLNAGWATRKWFHSRIMFQQCVVTHKLT
jgi:hypothetical protein